MTDARYARGRGLTAGAVLVAMILTAIASAVFAPKAHAAGCVSGTLIKGSLPAVYYCGQDGKRYVFTNDKAFFTWYADFSGIQLLSDAALGEIAIGGNVTYRPGKKMIKIQSDPKVYVINRGGVLKHIPDEECAKTLYGTNWNKEIDDVSDAFFVNYRMGTPLATCSDFDKTGEMNVSVSINIDKGLQGGGAIVIPAVSSVSPSAGSTNVSLSGDVMATFSKKMKADTLSSGTFSLISSGSGSAAVAGTVTYSGQTATFNPSADLAANTMYTATITTGAKDEDDRAMTTNYTWTFTTGAASGGSTGSGSSTQAVRISAITPADGGTGVAISAPIKITFSGAMDASTINSTNLVFRQGANTILPAAVTYANNVATVAPSAALLPGTTYTVTLTGAARDANGNGVEGGAYMWSFTTAQ